MKLKINNTTYYVSETWMNIRKTTGFEIVFFYFRLKSRPYVVFCFEILKMSDKNLFCFNKWKHLEHYIDDYEKVDSKDKCPFCNNFFDVSTNNGNFKCSHLNQYVSSILKQILEFPPLRLRTLHIKDKIDYNSF